MTEPTDSTTTTDAEPPEAADQGPNREAAKYRQQLRETESARDALAGQLDAMRRAEVERLAGNEHRLTEPAAFWATGTQLADLLTDDGQIDTDKVKSAADSAVAALGLARRPSGAYVPSEAACGAAETGCGELGEVPGHSRTA